MPPSIAQQHKFLDFAKEYNFDKVRELVEKDIAYVNAQPAGRWTALHQACHQGESSTVEFLLRKGADTTVTTKDGETPRAVAQGRGHTACVKLLDDHTAANEMAEGPTKVSRIGSGPFDVLILRSTDGVASSPLPLDSVRRSPMLTNLRETVTGNVVEVPASAPAVSFVVSWLTSEGLLERRAKPAADSGMSERFDHTRCSCCVGVRVSIRWPGSRTGERSFSLLR